MAAPRSSTVFELRSRTRTWCPRGDSRRRTRGLTAVDETLQSDSPISSRRGADSSNKAVAIDSRPWSPSWLPPRSRTRHSLGTATVSPSLAQAKSSRLHRWASFDPRGRDAAAVTWHPGPRAPARRRAPRSVMRLPPTLSVRGWIRAWSPRRALHDKCGVAASVSPLDARFMRSSPPSVPLLLRPCRALTSATPPVSPTGLLIRSSSRRPQVGSAKAPAIAAAPSGPIPLLLNARNSRCRAEARPADRMAAPSSPRAFEFRSRIRRFGRAARRELAPAGPNWLPTRKSAVTRWGREAKSADNQASPRPWCRRSNSLHLAGTVI
mmetsp:Transcript_2980/g.8541  ORF Transcript_2980/g.8541 Transcript_2980/m.8541 type:complete len:323 (+) Transcript_2980:461-1429(+)